MTKIYAVSIPKKFTVAQVNGKKKTQYRGPGSLHIWNEKGTHYL